MNIKAVAFDMDGLMFDTERLIQDAWERIGTEMGFEHMGDFIYQTLGINEEAGRKLFFKTFGDAFPYDEFRTRERAYRQTVIEANGFPVKPGLRELLDYLKSQEYVMVVATSTHTEVAKGYLTSENILSYFSGIIGGDQVTHSKPNPEIYLKACAHMNVKPAECLALEDSFAGVRAASAGGLIPVMVPDLMQPDEEIREKFYACVPSLFDVISLLKELR